MKRTLIESALASKPGIDRDAITLHYSKKGLHFYEAACTWIEDGVVTLQLHPSFKKRGRYLGYTKEEVIDHELIHCARSHLHEPVFEEILAYRSSPSGFRRYFGPIFRTSRESAFFVVALFATSLSTIFNIYPLLCWLGSGLLVGFGLLRLMRTQRLFKRAYKKMVQRVGEESAFESLITFTDREIIDLAVEMDDLT